jgi:hypothetical protein
MLVSSGAFGWIFCGLWALNLQMFLICGPLGPYKCRRFGINFSRAPGGDHSGAGGLLRFKIQQGDANLRRGHEPVRPERLLPGRQRGPLHAAERAHWPMARRGNCQLRGFVRGRRRVHEGRRFRAVDRRDHARQLAL